MKRFTFTVFFLFTVLFFTNPVAAQTIDFEDLTISADSYWNGSDEAGGFESRGVMFSNNYNMDWGSWDGFAYSNRTDTSIEGFDAQYNAIPGSGARGSKIYTVAYFSDFAAGPPTVSFDMEQRITGVYVTNTNYAFYSMRDGDAFAKKFTEEDWFKLTITGIDEAGDETGAIEFKLADGKSIVRDWTWVDLSALGPVKQLIFSLSSTDVGDWGMNTPAYFCLDNLNEDLEDDDSTCFINSIR